MCNISLFFTLFTHRNKDDFHWYYVHWRVWKWLRRTTWFDTWCSGYQKWIVHGFQDVALYFIPKEPAIFLSQWFPMRPRYVLVVLCIWGSALNRLPFHCIDVLYFLPLALIICIFLFGILQLGSLKIIWWISFHPYNINKVTQMAISWPFGRSVGTQFTKVRAFMSLWFRELPVK